MLTLIALGYSTPIGAWLSRHYGHAFGLSPRASIIWTIGVFMVAFAYCNSFVNSVFWYLFNDVVPAALLARFMSLFRLVSMLSASLYNLLIFQYTGSHATEILVGAGVLYFFGFGLICLMVKEEQYPPPTAYIDGKASSLSAIKTYAEECLSLPHYWFIFIAAVCFVLANSANVFQLFFYQSTGLDLAQIDRVNGIINIAVAIMIPFSGVLADRYDPVRVVIAGYIVCIALALPASMVWIFWHPAPAAAFWIWVTISVLFAVPSTALLGVFDSPLLMAMFPRSRYGQYCSANAMLRSLAAIVGEVAAGAFFDLLAHATGKQNAYHFMPVWQLVFSVPALASLLLLYRSWKRYGRPNQYVPPVPGETVSEVLHEELAEEVIHVPASA